MTVRNPNQAIGTLLSSCSSVLIDNTLRLEEAASRVVALVLEKGRPSSDLIMALQSFDRLKQEFEALGDLLRRYAECTRDGPLSDDKLHDAGRHAISTITVSDLRERLIRGLQDNDNSGAGDATPAAPDDEIGVDVTF